MRSMKGVTIGHVFSIGSMLDMLPADTEQADKVPEIE